MEFTEWIHNVGTNFTTMYLLNTLCPKPCAWCIHITFLIQLRQQFCERSMKEIVAQSEEVIYQKSLLANGRALFEPNPPNTPATKLLCSTSFKRNAFCSTRCLVVHSDKCHFS